MKVESALELVTQIVYKPGWRFEAVDHRNRFEGAICVTIHYPAVETGAHNAREGYPEVINTYASFPMVVEECDEIGLYRRMADAIDAIDEHEMREALRINGTFWAPFHPHRIDGMKRWNEGYGKGCEPLIIGDLQFGIA